MSEEIPLDRLCGRCTEKEICEESEKVDTWFSHAHLCQECWDGMTDDVAKQYPYAPRKEELDYDYIYTGTCWVTGREYVGAIKRMARQGVLGKYCKGVNDEVLMSISAWIEWSIDNNR